MAHFSHVHPATPVCCAQCGRSGGTDQKEESSPWERNYIWLAPRGFIGKRTPGVQRSTSFKLVPSLPYDMSNRLRALALYKELQRLGNDYPDPSWVAASTVLDTS